MLPGSDYSPKRIEKRVALVVFDLLTTANTIEGRATGLYAKESFKSFNRFQSIQSY
jgi:hypothetical protein